MLDLKTADITQTRFYQEVFQFGEQSGERKGRQEEAADLVLRQLSRRCGELSQSLAGQVRLLPIEQLEALGEALLDFRGIADLEAWLQRGEEIS